MVLKFPKTQVDIRNKLCIGRVGIICMGWGGGGGGGGGGDGEPSSPPTCTRVASCCNRLAPAVKIFCGI